MRIGAGLVGCAVLLAVGCGSSKPATLPAAAPARVPTSAPVDNCPSVSTPPAQWPAVVPSSLPKPPTAVLAGETIQSGVVSLRFTTSTSLRAGVLFVVNELPRAGYALSRGDAEAGEADAPFTGPTVVGALRLTRVGPCKTNWILAIVPRSRLNGASPNPGALIPHVTDPEASPLPFG